ncbi:MAG: DNA-3-methyladenine glycosylase [Rhodospirillales bacterium 20-60-12]|nr:MAG: DNA-3-methyladenine glycosylase [Rhodospirillales bacterium 20-60-12]HQT66554.1 DNA-3-methyladenine glycosylase [Acetobacteraceae bacterium]
MVKLNARQHLTLADPLLGALITRIGPCKLKAQPGEEPYQALVSAIAHQQLHARAATAMLGRLQALTNSTAFPAPAAMLSFSDEQMRACGFSGAKTAALRDLASKTIDQTVPTRRLAMRMTDTELIERLTEVRGIGRWTVEMLLIFSLGRPDVLPVDDFGVREGYRLLHGLEAQPKPKELAGIGEAFSPHRSTAAWYLWRAADEGKPAKPA